ncbi:MAG: hypothetical protein EOP88_11185 [Verrucomicrobiaceae bacterium]|nr:MAG: hypothetical protein EOP88_11185 [Verrucomicrobiaceae bacterium]
MTWRKLSRNLLLGSLFIMALVWVFANTHRTRYTLGSETRLRGVTVVRGSLEFFSSPQREAGARVDSWFEFMRLSGGFDYSLGHWSYTETPVRRRADYATGPPVPGMPPSPVVVDKMWSVQIPVWALWFPLAGFIVVFCRVMEKRSGGRKEKELAETLSE